MQPTCLRGKYATRTCAIHVSWARRVLHVRSLHHSPKYKMQWVPLCVGVHCLSPSITVLRDHLEMQTGKRITVLQKLVGLAGGVYEGL